MIHLNNIDKYYDSKFQRSFVLKAINLDVKEGEFVSIMGPSGSGKSTLLNIIGLLDTPSAGEYSLYDKSVLDLKEKVKVDYHRNFMGFIFQAYHLIEEMTVYENIETPLRSEEHTSELQSRSDLVCRLLLEKKKKHKIKTR